MFINSFIVLSIVLTYNKNEAAFDTILIFGSNSFPIPSNIIIFVSNVAKCPSIANPFDLNISNIPLNIRPKFI